MRKTFDLNHGWLFKKTFEEVDLSTSGGTNFKVVDLPHSNVELPYNNFDEKDYQFISSYIKHVFLEPLETQHSVFVRFEGVAGVADVFWNGYHLGTHKGGYTPFSFDVTNLLSADGNNILFVKADATERKDVPPHGFVVDYLTYGGIYREVSLEIVPQNHIKDVWITTTKETPSTWILSMNIELANCQGIACIIEAKVFTNNKEHDFEMKTVMEKTVRTCLSIENPDVWDIKNPTLSTMVINIKDEHNRLIDRIEKRFGFREIKTNQEGLWLNGEKVKLIGLNRHQAYPYVGYAMPKKVQQKDADILKYELGVNVVRSSHYPPSTYFLNRCDEIGLLVFVEIPGWQHIGDEKWKETALMHVEEMIRRDHNHPSVFIWGVRINESADDDAFYRATNAIAKTLDPSRPTGGVRNFAGSQLLEDVYTYNDFIHRGFNKGLEKPKRVMRKNVPYMVTEYNGHMFPTKKFDDEAHRIEHAVRHLRVQNDSFRYKSIMGAIGWCMNDYNTHKDFGSGDRICYHGVMDMFRISKYAAASYASQQSDFPVLEVLSSMNIGEYQASVFPPIYVLTNCDFVKVFKNKHWIGDFFPDRNEFKHLPHPPIIIKDFIGDQLEKNERFTKKDSSRIKKVLSAYTKYGFDMPIRYKLMMAYVMLKYKLDMGDAGRIFGKYLGDWGNENSTYEFHGWMKGKLVKQVVKGAAKRSILTAKMDASMLVEESTYDATRVVVSCQDEFGNERAYANNTISIETCELLDIIGPDKIALIGGSIAFWVRTKGKKGEGKIRIVSDFIGTCELTIPIK